MSHKPEDAESAKSDARVFRVNTQFQVMARRPGGVPKEKAIENANRFVEQAKPEMLRWMKEQVALLDVAIGKIEEDPGAASQIEQAQDLSRQVRDIGTTLGFSLLTFVANNLNEIFETMKQRTYFRKDIVSCHQLALRLSLLEEYRLMNPDNLPELKDGLLQVLAITSRRVDTAEQ